MDSENILDDESRKTFNINKTTTIFESRTELIQTIKMSEDLKIQETYLPKPSYDDPLVNMKSYANIGKIQKK